MRFGFQFTGGNDLERRLQAMALKPRKQVLLRSLEVAGLPILRVQEQLAPIDNEGPPPHLKFEIVMKPLRSLDGVTTGEYEAILAIGPSVRGFYGGQQEFGNINHPPQPFVRPAWDQEGGSKAQQRIGAELWTGIQAAK